MEKVILSNGWDFSRKAAWQRVGSEIVDKADICQSLGSSGKEGISEKRGHLSEEQAPQSQLYYTLKFMTIWKENKDRKV